MNTAKIAVSSLALMAVIMPAFALTANAQTVSASASAIARAPMYCPCPIQEGTAQSGSSAGSSGSDVRVVNCDCAIPVEPHGQVTLTSLSPTQGDVGQEVTIHGSGFAPGDRVLFAGGPAYSNGTQVSSDGTALTFTVPSSVGPDCKEGQACPMYARLITAGSYAVTVENADGVSNALTFTVTGRGATQPEPVNPTPPVICNCPMEPAYPATSASDSVSGTAGLTSGSVSGNATVSACACAQPPVVMPTSTPPHHICPEGSDSVFCGPIMRPFAVPVAVGFDATVNAGASVGHGIASFFGGIWSSISAAF